MADKNLIAVWPRDAEVRKHIRHPTGARFANWPDGTDWPNDSFTKRRVVEGAVLTQNPEPPMAVKPVEPALPASPVVQSPRGRRYLTKED